MKKFLLIFSLLFIIVLFSTGTGISQDHITSTGKAPISNRTSNFSQVRIPGLSETFCRYVYFYNTATSMIGRSSFDVGCPGGDLASWSPAAFPSSGVEGGNGNFYIICVNNDLCKLDTATGSVTILGSITGMGNASPNSIAYDVVNDSYYLCGNYGSINYLYKLDINTLTATLVSTIGSETGIMIAITIDSNGVGYGYSLLFDNNAYTFDPVTGTSSLLGPIGFTANYGQDMDIDKQTGIIYLAAYNFDTFEGELRTMDPNTGWTTLLYAWNDQIPVIEFDNGYNIIPVELSVFTADVNQGNVILNWSTATETNNRGFEIERSQKPKTKSQKWERIGFINGNGTTTESHSYSFIDNNVLSGTYIYRLKQMDFNGNYSYSKIIEVNVNEPLKLSLSQNYPNPFNPTTNIKYQIPKTSFVTLKVYDILGNEVATLVNEKKSAGKYTVEFSVGQDSSPDLASGVYYYRLTEGNYTSVKKMLLLK